MAVCRSPMQGGKPRLARCSRSASKRRSSPGDFPLALADRLRKDGVVLTVDDAAVELRRRAKASAELERIRAAQRAAEAGVIELPDEAESISYRWAASRGRRAKWSSSRSPCLA